MFIITVNYSFNSSACRILALFAGCCRNVNGLGGGATASFLAFLGLGMELLCRVFLCLEVTGKEGIQLSL